MSTDYTYHPDGRTRRQNLPYPKAQVHRLCDFCGKWYQYRDMNGYGKYQFCANCNCKEMWKLCEQLYMVRQEREKLLSSLV